MGLSLLGECISFRGNLHPMSAQLLGAHMPTGKGLGNALREGKKIGCTAVQVFTASPQMWKAAPVTPEKVADFKKAQEETGIDVVVSHDSYLVNLCAPNPEIHEKSINGLKGEIERCAAYGIRWLVSHMGSHMDQTEEVGLQRVAETALKILDETPDTVMLLAETTARQGSALDYRFEQLARLFELMKGHPRLGVCLDTCHIFAAGYDIRTADTYERTFAEFDRLIGIPNIKAIHCNDSKNDIGTRKDRHEHIGKGFIGEEAFRRSRALELRIRRANIPDGWSLDTFPFHRQPGVSRAQIEELAELDWILKAINLIFIGLMFLTRPGTCL